MEDMKLGLVESHFADIVWENEPIHSRELVKLCDQELNWKRVPHIRYLESYVIEAFSGIRMGWLVPLFPKQSFMRSRVKNL